MTVKTAKPYPTGTNLHYRDLDDSIGHFEVVKSGPKYTTVHSLDYPELRDREVQTAAIREGRSRFFEVTEWKQCRAAVGIARCYGTAVERGYCQLHAERYSDPNPNPS